MSLQVKKTLTVKFLEIALPDNLVQKLEEIAGIYQQEEKCHQAQSGNISSEAILKTDNNGG